MSGPPDRGDALCVRVHRHFEVCVPERLLDGFHVLSIRLHQGAEAMPQGVSADRLRDLQVV